jgi:hypothetical protein
MFNFGGTLTDQYSTKNVACQVLAKNLTKL